MRVVYKYPLPLEPGGVTVRMPRGAVILHLAVQHGVPCLWAEVDPAAPERERTFLLVPTGGQPPSQGAYLATLLMGGGDYVWHYYEVPT
jgi:hypothetical protein